MLGPMDVWPTHGPGADLKDMFYVSKGLSLYHLHPRLIVDRLTSWGAARKISYTLCHEDVRLC